MKTSSSSCLSLLVVLSVTSLFVLFFYSGHNSRSPLSLFPRPSIDPSSYSSPHVSQPRQPPSMPLPLSAIYTLRRTDSLYETHASVEFTQPLVIHSYVRPSLTSPAPAIDLYMITLGLTVRNLSLSSCITFTPAGPSAAYVTYPVVSYSDEVAICRLPEPPPQGTKLTATFVQNNDFQVALSRDISLDAGYIARRLLPSHGVTPLRNSNGTSVTEYALPSAVYFNSSSIDGGEYNIGPKAPFSKARYPVCMMTMTSTVPETIPAWLDYHRRLGVDHVYIFDNGSPLDLTAEYATRRDVEVIAWPWPKSQTQAMTFILLSARTRCERVLRIDTDEYLLIGLGASPFAGSLRPLHQFLRRVEVEKGKKSVQIRSLLMCNSGYVEKPKSEAGSVPELYTHMRKDPNYHNGKSICSSDENWLSARVHWCGKLIGGKRSQQHFLKVEDVKGNLWPREEGDAPWLVHFFARSWEEWVEKWTVGTAGATSGIKRDYLIGKYNLSRVNAEYVNKDSKSCFKYTFFKEVYQRVKKSAEERVGEAVVAWWEEGVRKTMVVDVGNGTGR